MSKAIEFKGNNAGIQEMLKSPEMQDVLLGYAQQVQFNAGQNYEVKELGTRVVVVPSNEQGENDNYENNTLLKAVNPR
jgi:hypothetical protein